MNKNYSNITLINRLLLPTIILFGAFLYFLEVEGFSDARNRLLISPVFWIMLVLYPLIIWQEWKTLKKGKRNPDSAENNTQTKQDENEEDLQEGPLSKKLIVYMVAIAVYLALVPYVGFVIMTLIFLPVMMWVLGTKSRKLLITIPVVVVLIIYFIFVQALGIPFPVWPGN